MFLSIDDVLNHINNEELPLDNLMELYLPSFFEDTVAIEIDGSNVGYTSVELIEYFKKDTTKLFKKVQKEYTYSLENFIMIPAYKSGGLFSEITSKIFDPLKLSKTMAFFSSEINKIFLIVSNMTNIFGDLGEYNLRGLIVHEFDHFFCYNFNNQFIKLNGKRVTAFYSYFFYHLFDEKVPMTKIKPIAAKLAKIMIRNERYVISNKKFVSFVSRIYKLIKKDFGEADTFIMNRITMIGNSIYYVFLAQDYMSYIKECTPVYKALVQAYRSMGSSHGDSFVCQELVFPSEIISIMDQHEVSDKWFTFFKNIHKSKESKFEVPINV